MRAAVHHRRGEAAEVLEVIDLPDPDPAGGEVRVRVLASGVNPSDVKSRMGKSSGQSGSGEPLPFDHQIPHQDGSGIVDAVGAGVDGSRVGEAVWLYNAAHERATGTAAELVCLPEHLAVPLPDGIPMGQAAGLGIPYVTAHRCLLADGELTDATVLVTGGAGAVGNAAIQLARYHGARVIATTSTEEKADLARAAGAEATIDYRAADVTARLEAAAPAGIDRVIDVSMMTNLPTYVDLLNPHAVAVGYAEIPGATGPEWPPLMSLRVKNLTLRFVRAYGLTAAMQDAAKQDITRALEAGALHPLPEHDFPLERIIEAHQAVEQGVTGKVIVNLP